MNGGSGADIFVMLQESVKSGETDFIFDFNSAEGDRIDLSAIDANTLLDSDQAFTMVASVGSGYGEMTVQFAAGTTLLRFYVDGDKTLDYQIRLTGDHRDTLAVNGDSPPEMGGWIL